LDFPHELAFPIALILRQTISCVILLYSSFIKLIFFCWYMIKLHVMDIREIKLSLIKKIDVTLKSFFQAL
jgi:hypothetical protein